MIASLLLCLPCATACAATPAPPPGGRATAPAGARQDEGDEEEKPDKRPEIKALLAELKGHVGKRGKEDKEAVAAIDELLQEFPQSGPKDRKSICDGLSKCFEVRRIELEKGVPNNSLFIAAGTALGRMGPESASVLDKWIGHKKHRKDLALQRVLILSLGKTKNDRGIKTLIDLLQSKDDMLVGAAAEALADYAGKKLEIRKDIFEALLKTLMPAKATVDVDVNDTIARERYDVIAAPIITTLQAVSGHDERDPDKWQRWWNKNKKKDWDEEE